MPNYLRVGFSLKFYIKVLVVSAGVQVVELELELELELERGSTATKLTFWMKF
jgi:hypothetical protein